MAYTVSQENFEKTDDILEAIRKRETKSAGSHLSIPAKIVRAFQIHF